MHFCDINLSGATENDLLGLYEHIIPQKKAYLVYYHTDIKVGFQHVALCSYQQFNAARSMKKKLKVGKGNV